MAPLKRVLCAWCICFPVVTAFRFDARAARGAFRGQSFQCPLIVRMVFQGWFRGVSLSL